MTISEIASISGKGGLFKVLAPTKSAIILESLDDTKTRMVATSHHRVSLLHEISIYTTTKDRTVPLADVLQKMYTDFGDDPGVDGNSDPIELKSFLKSVLPDYDEDRVYVSDIRKLVKWYAILLQHAPEIIKGEGKRESKDLPDESANKQDG
jgi:Domain of unknown function (DUF6852)/Domain of unknown function (DUF5606)